MQLMSRNLSRAQLRQVNIQRCKRAGVPVGDRYIPMGVSAEARARARPNVDMFWICCRG